MDDKDASMAELRVDGLEPRVLEVVEFTGRDALSTPYEFHVLCASTDPGLASRRMARRSASLLLAAAEWRNAYSGVLFSFRKMQTVDELTFYKTLLTPRLKLLELTEHNQVFLNRSLPQIIDEVFQECGVTNYEMRFVHDYPEMEYVCQYNETHFNFLSRWLEHYGVYYYFEEGPAGEKCILTDSKISHMPLAERPFDYRQPSAMDREEKSHAVFALDMEESIVPRTVVLKDYNYLRPDIELLAEAEADPEGVGTTYHYGDHFQTVEQGQALAKVRAQELLAGARVFRGKSGCLPFRAGGLAAVSGHPDPTFNRTCLLTEAAHQGRPSNPLTSGLDVAASLGVESGCRNAFSAIAAEVQFRPRRLAQKPRMAGVLTARIDAEGSGQYAQLDELGRYKARLPFDLAGRPDGHASAWLRLAEPYAGGDYGVHFPLHKGTEVLLAFVNADPDRPVIASAVHNGENRNPIKDERERLSLIKTAGNNQVVMNDAEGREGLALWSPYHNSGFALGALNPGGGGSIVTQTSGQNETLIKGASNTAVLGETTQVVGGATNYVYGGSLANVLVGMGLNFNLGTSFTVTKGAAVNLGDAASDLKTDITQIGQNSLSLSGGVSQIASAPIDTVKKAVAAAAAGVAAGTVGAALATEFFGEKGAFDEASKGWKIGGGALGAALMAAGLVTVPIAGIVAYRAAQAFEAAAKQARTANLTLDRAGATLGVSNTVSPGAGFSVNVGQEIGGDYFPLLSSSIRISPDGDSITITNKDGAVIRISDGANISLSVGPYGEETARVTLGMESISLRFNAVQCNMSDMGMTLLVEDSSKITITPEGITFLGGGSTLNLQPEGISMRSATWAVNEGAMRVDEAGMVTLG